MPITREEFDKLGEKDWTRLSELEHKITSFLQENTDRALNIMEISRALNISTDLGWKGIFSYMQLNIALNDLEKDGTIISKTRDIEKYYIIEY